ncbi:MAG: succinate dehydrogenase cytochrome b subunit [bacterium]
MKQLWTFFASSLGRKYLMSVTGCALSLFALVHMVGNLQIFLGKETINAYGYHLHTLPWPIFWGFRLGLATCALVHIVVAAWLTTENLLARPKGYRVKKAVEASWASRTMPLTGALLLAFIVFHLANFTLGITPEPYDITLPRVTMEINDKIVKVFDVYAMMISSFSIPWLSVSYIIAMGLLCFHLAHGIGSMFQSVGLRNHKWRFILDKAGAAYGWFLFIGFAIIPVAVLTGFLK